MISVLIGGRQFNLSQVLTIGSDASTFLGAGRLGSPDVIHWCRKSLVPREAFREERRFYQSQSLLERIVGTRGRGLGLLTMTFVTELLLIRQHRLQLGPGSVVNSGIRGEG